LVPSIDWNKYGYIVASGYRKRIILSIGKAPKTPKQVAVETGLRLSHVSKVLHELVNKDLIKCITPNLSKGKLFNLTKTGENIVLQLKVTEPVESIK